jgi:hypothetical protein
MAMNGYLVRGHMKFYDVVTTSTSTATNTESNTVSNTEQLTTTMEEYINYIKNGHLIDRKDKFIGHVLSKHCEELHNELILKNHEIEYDYDYSRDALSNVLYDLTVLSTKMGFTLEELMERRMDI